MTLVSIVIPVFNMEENLLDRALSSAFSQTYPQIEVILVDDGSAPPLAGRLGSAHMRRSNLHLVTLASNGGISAARNAGVERASGTMIVWLDADDTLDPDCVKSLYIAAKDNDLVIGECDVWEAGEVTRRRPSPYFQEARATLGTLEDPFLLNVISLQPQMFRREAFINLGGFDLNYRYAELTEIFLRYIARHGLSRVALTENAIYNYYRDRPESVSMQRIELTRYRERCLNEYLVRNGFPSKRVRYVERNPKTQMQQFMVDELRRSR